MYGGYTLTRGTPGMRVLDFPTLAGNIFFYQIMRHVSQGFSEWALFFFLFLSKVNGIIQCNVKNPSKYKKLNDCMACRKKNRAHSEKP